MRNSELHNAQPHTGQYTVVCINNRRITYGAYGNQTIRQAGRDILTLYKSYVVLRSGNGLITTVDDIGREHGFLDTRFVSPCTFRSMKMRKIISNMKKHVDDRKR